MSEEKKKKKNVGAFSTPAFNTPHPWRKRADMTQTDEVVEEASPKRAFFEPRNSAERVGPFYRPKQLTPEEKAEKKKQKDINNVKLKLMLKEKDYDRYTVLIATILGVFSFGFAKFYLKFFQMFNAGVVEGVGILIYYTFLPLFLAMSGNAYLAITLTIPISFFCKFVLYKMWMFKKVESLKPPAE